MSRWPLASAEPPRSLPGRLGRYTLAYELAAGGMATVYLARMEGQVGFEKVVAVKVIHPHLAGEREFVEMFLNEARIASAIDHPNVCTVFDFGEADGLYYLAMEYLLGEHLLRIAKRVAERRSPEMLRRLPLYAARIFADACEGLHAAHELCAPDGTPLGVVHRDVTPKNLFVTYEGAVKVVDFGVARAAHQLHHTEAGKIKGKVAYVSPEQLRNRPLDRRTDVWSLGVCLWEMLVLRRLFRRDSDAATMRAVIEDPIPPPSTVRGWVPAELDGVVARALARDRDARYPTAREFGRDLRRFLAASGALVEMAELAEWMQAMFAEDREARLELVRRARQVHTGPVGRVPRALGGDVSDSSSGVPSVSMEVPALSLEGEEAAPPRRRRSVPWVVAGLGGALALAAGLGGAWLASPDTVMVVQPLPPRTPAGAPAAGAPAAGEAERPAEPTAEREPQSAAAAVPDEAGHAATAAAPAAEPRAEAPPGPRAAGSAARAAPRSPPAKRAEKAQAEPSPPPPPAGGTGIVHVTTSTGWADVYAGERRLGRTPLSAPLPAGTHRLRILPYGEGPAHVQSVEVERGAVVLLRVTLREPD